MLFWLTVLFFLPSLSCDRSFTPTHPSYYSPKHESMMEEMLSCQQVWHHTLHTNQPGGSRHGFYVHSVEVHCDDLNRNNNNKHMLGMVCTLSRCRRCPERTRGARIVLAGAQRTWITWFYPPAPFTPGTCVHYTQQDIAMNECV